MTSPRRKISPERKASYYAGMALLVVGLAVFASALFAGPTLQSRRLPDPSQPEFFENAMKHQEEFGKGISGSMSRVFIGIGLLAAGGFLMRIGARGTAGSGLVLNPEKARQDVEPWSRMGGGMVQDALSEITNLPVIGKPDADLPSKVKVRCQKCRALNDESAKFCGQCGAAV